MEWNSIDSVFLDMDGTLLDLNYDNHFWLSHVPRRYAEKHDLSVEESKQRLVARYKSMEGRLQWYCVDYWTHELGLDIARLKREVEHLIAVHPRVDELLTQLRAVGKRTVLVTNAHRTSLDIKMHRTGLDTHFDAIVSAHDFGIAKEQAGFWDSLQRVEAFSPKHTLLVDDSLAVLRAARQYGIAHLLAVRKPDSVQPERSLDEFPSISGLSDLVSQIV
ncbi:MAG: GMP/IMP nucleotidase [Burkholderiales bacterium]